MRDADASSAGATGLWSLPAYARRALGLTGPAEYRTADGQGWDHERWQVDGKRTVAYLSPLLLDLATRVSIRPPDAHTWEVYLCGHLCEQPSQLVVDWRHGPSTRAMRALLPRVGIPPQVDVSLIRGLSREDAANVLARTADVWGVPVPFLVERMERHFELQEGRTGAPFDRHSDCAKLPVRGRTIGAMLLAYAEGEADITLPDLADLEAWYAHPDAQVREAALLLLERVASCGTVPAALLRGSGPSSCVEAVPDEQLSLFP